MMLLPECMDNQHIQAASFSALRTRRLYPPGHTPGSHFHKRLSGPEGSSAARRIKLMKNPNDPNWNRTRYLPTCSAVLPPPASPCTTSMK